VNTNGLVPQDAKTLRHISMMTRVTQHTLCGIFLMLYYYTILSTPHDRQSQIPLKLTDHM